MLINARGVTNLADRVEIGDITLPSLHQFKPVQFHLKRIKLYSSYEFSDNTNYKEGVLYIIDKKVAFLHTQKDNKNVVFLVLQLDSFYEKLYETSEGFEFFYAYRVTDEDINKSVFRDTLIDISNQFRKRLFERLEQTGNVAFSPFSLSYTMLDDDRALLKTWKETYIWHQLLLILYRWYPELIDAIHDN